MNACTERG